MSTPSQRAMRIYAKKEDRPVNPSEAETCCCMVAPWRIKEEDRSYILKVTKPKQTEFGGRPKTVSEPEPASNEKSGRYELHIVAPEVDKSGKITYKKITSNHTFLYKECDLCMQVSDGSVAGYIKENESFEIDSDGRLKGALEMYGGVPEECRVPNPDEFDTLRGYVDAAASCMDENVTAAYIESIKSQEVEEPEDGKSDLETVLGALINPVNAARRITVRPVGSTKCETVPKAVLYVYPSTKADGGFSFYYQKGHKNRAPDSKSRVEVTTGKLEVKGRFNLYHGSEVISFDGSHSAGGHTFVRKKRPHERRARRAGKNLFSTAERILGYVKEMEEAQHRRNRSLQRASTAAKKHPMIKFDPGKTGFALAVKNHRIKEIDDDYTVDYESDMSLNFQILNGVGITVDCIEFVIRAATGRVPRVAKLLSSARDTLDEGVGWSRLNAKAGAAIELSVKGGINSTLSWKKELKRAVEIKEEKIAGVIGFGAKAHIYAESELLFVTIKGEAGGMAASALKATIPSQLTLKGSLKQDQGRLKLGVGADFTGLALYYVLKGSLDYKKGATDKGKHKGGFVKKQEMKVSKETKWEKLVLIEAWDDKAGEKDAYIDVEQFFG